MLALALVVFGAVSSVTTVERRGGAKRRGAGARALAILPPRAPKREHRSLQVREEAVMEYLAKISTVKVIADRHGVCGAPSFLPTAATPVLPPPPPPPPPPN
jgi:hypothetical protein